MEGKIAYWQPRVMRHIFPDGSAQYAIHDVYFANDGRVLTCTEHARSARKGSVVELGTWIRSVLKEGATQIICGDLGYTHTVEDDLTHWLQHINDPPIDFASVGG